MKYSIKPFILLPLVILLLLASCDIFKPKKDFTVLFKLDIGKDIGSKNPIENSPYKKKLLEDIQSDDFLIIPNAFFIDKGQLYIADHIKQKVLVYSLKGNLLKEIDLSNIVKGIKGTNENVEVVFDDIYPLGKNLIISASVAVSPETFSQEILPYPNEAEDTEIYPQNIQGRENIYTYLIFITPSYTNYTNLGSNLYFISLAESSGNHLICSYFDSSNNIKYFIVELTPKNFQITSETITTSEIVDVYKEDTNSYSYYIVSAFGTKYPKDTVAYIADGYEIENKKLAYKVTKTKIFIHSPYTQVLRSYDLSDIKDFEFLGFTKEGILYFLRNMVEKGYIEMLPVRLDVMSKRVEKFPSVLLRVNPLISLRKLLVSSEGNVYGIGLYGNYLFVIKWEWSPVGGAVGGKEEKGTGETEEGM